jgi:hypothetical protein
MDKSYEVTPEDCNEAITQEIYIQAGFKTSLCVLLLNTGFNSRSLCTHRHSRY